MAALRDCHDFVASSSAPLQAAARHPDTPFCKASLHYPDMCLSNGRHSHWTHTLISYWSAPSRQYIADGDLSSTAPLSSNIAVQHDTLPALPYAWLPKVAHLLGSFNQPRALLGVMNFSSFQSASITDSSIIYLHGHVASQVLSCYKALFAQTGLWALF